jgi:hypothetical protein
MHNMYDESNHVAELAHARLALALFREPSTIWEFLTPQEDRRGSLIHFTDTQAEQDPMRLSSEIALPPLHGYLTSVIPCQVRELRNVLIDGRTH